LLATPIKEIEQLHSKEYAWNSVTAADANQKLNRIAPGPLHVKISVTLERDDDLVIRYQQSVLTAIKSGDLENGKGSVEILIDKSVAEVFVDGGMRYIVKEMPAATSDHGLEFAMGRTGSIFNALEVYKMSSIWQARRK
jgi:sucrose-6-phosphate hydrolase SacC (GH32 family)